MRNTAGKDGGGAQEERSNLLTSKSCTMAPAGKVDMQQSNRKMGITTTSATITAPPTSAKVTSIGKGHTHQARVHRGSKAWTLGLGTAVESTKYPDCPRSCPLMALTRDLESWPAEITVPLGRHSGAHMAAGLTPIAVTLSPFLGMSVYDP